MTETMSQLPLYNPVTAGMSIATMHEKANDASSEYLLGIFVDPLIATPL
jgi:hypothetical protein